MKVTPPSSCLRVLCGVACQPKTCAQCSLGLLQAEGRTCEDFQDEHHYSSSPDSSFSPFDGDLTTASSSFTDSLPTEGKA